MGVLTVPYPWQPTSRTYVPPQATGLGSAPTQVKTWRLVAQLLLMEKNICESLPNPQYMNWMLLLRVYASPGVAVGLVILP